MPENEAPAAFLALWREKVFLGREFLTWLWLTSEIHGNLLKLKPQGEVELWFEDRLTLESGEGAGRKTVVCRDPESKWIEALTALREGKQVTRGRLRICTENKEWRLTLNSDTLTPQAVTFIKGLPDQNGPPEETDVVERTALLGELLGLIEALCRLFLERRLSDIWADEERPALNKWLAARL